MPSSAGNEAEQRVPGQSQSPQARRVGPILVDEGAALGRARVRDHRQVAAGARVVGATRVALLHDAALRRDVARIQRNRGAPRADFGRLKHPVDPELYTLSLHDALPISAATTDSSEDDQVRSTPLIR